jgi:hypothetical protein
MPGNGIERCLDRGSVGYINEQPAIRAEETIDLGKDLVVGTGFLDVAEGVSHDEHMVKGFGRKPRAPGVCPDKIHRIVKPGSGFSGVIDEVRGIIDEGAAAHSPCAQFETMTAVTAAKIQDSMFRTDRKEFTNEVHLATSNVLIAN